MANGRSGQSEVLAADSAPGLVAAMVTTPSDKEQYALHTLLAGGGVFRVG